MSDTKVETLTGDTGRRSHTFCGVLCDCRIAVAGIDGILALLLIITFINPLNLLNPFNLIRVGCLCAGIYGAYDFNSQLVGVAGIFHLFGVLFYVWGLFTGGDWLPWSALYAYPHYILYKEIEDGIMSHSTYPEEQHIIGRS